MEKRIFPKRTNRDVRPARRAFRFSSRAKRISFRRYASMSARFAGSILSGCFRIHSRLCRALRAAASASRASACLSNLLPLLIERYSRFPTITGCFDPAIELRFVPHQPFESIPVPHVLRPPVGCIRCRFSRVELDATNMFDHVITPFSTHPRHAENGLHDSEAVKPAEVSHHHFMRVRLAEPAEED